MKKTILNIPTLSPIIFRKSHIQNNTDELLNDDAISEFFIHSLKENDVKLNLPLPPHKKTVNDFVFITNGSMIRNLGIESFELKKNDFLFVPKNSITTTEFISEDLEGFFCHFSNEFIGANPFLGTFDAHSNNQNVPRLSENDANSLESLLFRILQLYKTRKSDPNNYRLIPFYLATVIAELFLMSKKHPVIPQQNKVVSSIFKNLVHQHFKQNLSIAEYSSLLSITPNHLNKKVKNETGKTASEIIKEISMLEAKVLLLQSNLSINEISEALGFNDASYFSRLFKNETNFSPTDYRKMIDLS